MTNVAASMAQRTPVEDVLTSYKALKGDSGYQTLSGAFETLIRDDNSLFPLYRENMKTLKRKNRTKLTPQGDYSVIAPYIEDEKTRCGDLDNTLNINRRKHSTLIGGILSTLGPRNEGAISLSPNGDDKKYLAT